MIALPDRIVAASREPRVATTAGRAWPRADLRRRVRQAIDLAHRALRAALAQDESLPPSPNARRQADAESEPRPLVLSKVVAEAAMLARCALLADPGDAALRAAVETLAIELAPHARGESVQALICNDPTGAIGHASAHVFLSDIGHRDARFERFLQDVLAADPVGGPERLPNQQLEWHWLEQIRTKAVDTAFVDRALLAQTCVRRPLDVLGCSTIDLYVFTHVVLYASDTGRRAVPWPRGVEALASDAEAALVAAIDADNFDLAAELLWTWPMLALPWSAGASFAFELLACVQDEHDFLPGPGYSVNGLLTTPAAGRDDYLLRTSYHATLVMGLLCSAALRASRTPTRTGATARALAPGADPLLQWLPATSRRPRWLGMYATVGETDRASLGPFVLGAALRRAASGHDIRHVRRILEAALDTAWSEGPAMRQALALLRRANALAALHSGSATILAGSNLVPA